MRCPAQDLTQEMPLLLCSCQHIVRAHARFQALIDSDADPDGLIDRYSGTKQIGKLRYVTGSNSKLLSLEKKLAVYRLEAQEWKDNMEALVRDTCPR
jgi:hypothetical protein